LRGKDIRGGEGCQHVMRVVLSVLFVCGYGEGGGRARVSCGADGGYARSQRAAAKVRDGSLI